MTSKVSKGESRKWWNISSELFRKLDQCPIGEWLVGRKCSKYKKKIILRLNNDVFWRAGQSSLKRFLMPQWKIGPWGMISELTEVKEIMIEEPESLGLTIYHNYSLYRLPSECLLDSLAAVTNEGMTSFESTVMYTFLISVGLYIESANALNA